VSVLPLAERIVEVIGEFGPPGSRTYRYGSGCRVIGQVVLTAAHVVAGAHSVSVRGPDKVEYLAGTRLLSLPYLRGRSCGRRARPEHQRSARLRP
jgi:hypothetical protein